MQMKNVVISPEWTVGSRLDDWPTCHALRVTRHFLVSSGQSKSSEGRGASSEERGQALSALKLDLSYDYSYSKWED